MSGASDSIPIIGRLRAVGHADGRGSVGLAFWSWGSWRRSAARTHWPRGALCLSHARALRDDPQPERCGRALPAGSGHDPGRGPAKRGRRAGLRDCTLAYLW